MSCCLLFDVVMMEANEQTKTHVGCSQTDGVKLTCGGQKIRVGGSLSWHVINNGIRSWRLDNVTLCHIQAILSCLCGATFRFQMLKKTIIIGLAAVASRRLKKTAFETFLKRFFVILSLFFLFICFYFFDSGNLAHVTHINTYTVIDYVSVQLLTTRKKV